MTSPHPRVGVAVFVLHPTSPDFSHDQSPHLPSQEYKFLLGKRLGSHGAGTWALPGGHLEFGETFDECAAREVQEETGLDVEGVEFLTATNDLMPCETDADERGKHYVTVFMTARVKVSSETAWREGMPEAQLLEPNKCAGWEWVSWGSFVGWARPQMEALDLVEAGTGEGGQGSDGQGEEAAERRILFSPMIALLVQRPGSVPSLT